MARQNLEDGRSFGEQRGKINDNFIELYADKADLSAVLTKTNTISYSPSLPYHPATKGYADGVGTALVAVYDPTGVASDAFARSNHIGTQPPSSILETVSDRFVSDTQVATWDAKEPAISKNTGFNKNFGNTASDVSQGNHTHPSYEPVNANIQAHITDVTGNPHIVTAAQVGAEAANSNIQTHINDVFLNPHNVTKALVGLGNVDNTADASKPVSTDQAAALDLKVNIIGSDRLQLIHPATTPEFLEGLIFYEETHRSLSLYTDIPDVTHNLGQELLLRVYNDSGATIVNGAACRHDGAELATGFPKIVPAIADSFRNAQVIGIATHAIEDGDFGFITRSGVVHEVDVNGITVGNPIYLSATVAGEFTGSSPDIISRLGYVLVAGLEGRMLAEIHNNIVIPTVFGLLQGVPGTDVFTLSTTPEDIDGYVTDYDTGILVVGSTGYMTMPNDGWYRLTISVTVTVTPGSPAQEHNVKFDLYRTNNTPGIVDFTTLTLPSDSVDVTGSRSATIPFHADEGDVLVMQVSSSDSTEDLTFDSSSFDIESISIS